MSDDMGELPWPDGQSVELDADDLDPNTIMGRLIEAEIDDLDDRKSSRICRRLPG